MLSIKQQVQAFEDIIQDLREEIRLLQESCSHENTQTESTFVEEGDYWTAHTDHYTSCSDCGKFLHLKTEDYIKEGEHN